MSKFKTLLDLIEARKNEEQKGITFILGDTEERYVSYKEMYQTSLRLLHVFQESGYKQGDEVIFQIENNERFVYSFWACILGGMIPVPITTGNNDEHKLKLFKIWSILNNPRIIISAGFMEKLSIFANKNGFSSQIETMENNTIYIEDAIQTEKYGDIYYPKSEDIAFIQFSSGSTGDPKGVIITHSNVLVDLNAVIKWDNIDSNDVGLNWMPLTHDMGLIGTHIKGILACINQYNMQTQLFVRHPSLWIQKVSEHKATLLYSPNFGCKHFLKFYNPEVKQEWDLSSVRYIYNGAEPISLDLCNEFLDKMDVYGLKRNTMKPVYGLAEGTIAVAFPKAGEELSYHVLDRNHLKTGEIVVDAAKEDKNAVVFLDEGYPIYNSYVRICDRENKDIGENRIGYVQISGGNVTSGYYNNKQATQEAITADGWLNTGDLGFMRNKRLIITGRSKDIIFVAGQNFYSHDIERIGECVEEIELGKIVATGVFNDRLRCDELIVFVMYRQKIESFISIASRLKKTISQRIGIEISEVIPVRDIPKTTSGKVQRYKLRENYINGEYDLITQQIHTLMTEEFSNREIVQPVTTIEKELVKIWSEILNNDKIGIHDNFFELGGDSLRITQMTSRVRDGYQVELTQAEIFENPEIENLAKVIEGNVKGKNKMSEICATYYNLGKTPLSFAQQRLWFLDRLNLQSPQYNLSTGLVLKGSLNIDALIKSFNEIIKRHKLLQAYFIEENGLPVQILDQEIKMPMEFVDLRGIPEVERRTKALDLAKNEAKKPFILEKAPLIRGNLLCIDENEHMLILVVHHIVFDGWSFGILLNELNCCYEAFIKGNKQPLPEMSIQYADFSQWQKENIQAGCLDKQLEYWKKQLDGSLTVLDLPLDKQRPPIQTYNGAKFTSFIPVELVNELQKYARKENVTLFMVLLSAFKVLLYRYSGQSDIIIGSPIANRNRKDIEGLIGFFTNNIILRTCFSNEISFDELLKKVKQVTLEAYSNQDVPFEKLVEELHVQRDMSRNPLFQVLFGMQNMPIPLMEFSELNISTLDMDAGYSRFDLAVDIRNAGEGLNADFEYNTDLFNSDTIIRMAGHYRQLLIGIVKNPCLMLNDYEIMTTAEKKTILCDWNDTKEDIADFSSWTDIFTKQAEVNPGAVAVVCGKQQMTYAKLDESSNRLAQYLLSCGVGAESIVGVYLDRSIDMLVGLMGIHKTGAAYLPMDPIFPKERLAYMIEDSNVSIILSEKNLFDTLPNHSARVICLDAEQDIISKYSAQRIALNKESNNLAYVIYTSGSTGKPKGVQIEQYALINLLLSLAKKTEMKENDSLLAVTTLSFDIAGLELYMPLICGAKVVIAQRDDVMDGNKLIRMLNEQSITMMQATPATWRLLIESGWTGCRSLKILCGGEALPKDLSTQLLDRCGVLYNVYGPTETTIWSTVDTVDANTKAISIGKPIANTQVYVVDESMNPVPIGIPGELLIGGDGLARGYMNLPVLTKEKFIPDLFKKIPGTFLYKTGDVVKFTSDGKLEYVGRKDNQVKIRGFRIELGEIEALINMEQSVKECVVVAKELIPGELSLVAYIIPSSETISTDIDTDYIRKSLKEKLPDYMVPAAFMVMNSLPMTPNGKIDRKALPVPERIIAKQEINYTAPSSKIENQLESIWREVLKLDKIDVNSSFFDLGGHSLLLAQVRSKIENVLKKEVSMMDLFKYPTIATLSGFLLGNNEAETITEDVKKQDSGTKSTKIAVIGLSGRFPGAKNIDEFWNNLCNGVNSISHFTEEQVIEEGISPELVKKPGYVKAWGSLEDIDKFDAQFFGYNPREAEVLDPQQRIFLEESWKALEDANYNTEKFKGLVGVYGSVGMNTYVQRLKDGYESQGLASDYQIMISNDKDFLATRVAYKLNLEGPSITVQTACSSSLVAVHLACQSLVNGECDMALAGGVSIRLPQRAGYMYQEGMILSPDGICKAFDEQASGTVGGNGAGVIVLKRLEDAVADGDDISAVILGSAINNDGGMKIGYTAPRIEGQAKSIAKAQANAGIDPESITYIEAHGTGTPLGDPIEIEALTKVFRLRTDKKEFCAIGSVKTNIGHLDAAAGITGLIKTILSLRNRMLPPSLNFRSPNPKLNIKESPFFVNNSLTAWNNGSNPLRAGVSAFGIGGTNAHVVLEEGPIFSSDSSEGKPLLFTLSAKNKKALNRMTTNLISFLESSSDINLADVAYTLQVGRKVFEFKRFFLSSSIQETLEVLKNIDGNPQRVFDSTEEQNHSSQQSLLDNMQDYPLEQLGQMWLSGVRIDWEKLYQGQKRKRISLPTYPFEGQSFWAKKVAPAAIVKSELEINKRSDVSEWFYTPIWKQSVDCSSYDIDNNDYRKGVLLVLTDNSEFSTEFEAKLKERNADFVLAVSGKEYKLVDEGNYTFDPEDSTHYDQLLSELSKIGKTPTRIVNLLGMNTAEMDLKPVNNLYWGERLFFSMMYLAQAIGKNSMTTPIQIKVFTNNSQRILGEQELNPGKVLHLGACRVIPKEYPNIKCCSIDCILSDTSSIHKKELIDLLIDEVYFMPCDGLIAYRGMGRWKQEFESIKPNVKNSRSIKLKDDGVYVITGGLGGIGVETAQYIAREVRAKLVLITRSKFPEIEQWESWLETHSKRDDTSRKIMRLKEITSYGAEVFIYQADVCEENELRDIRERIIQKLGKIDGIVHAAGNPGGGMIQLKKKEQAKRVLAPKVQGTIALFDTFKDCGLDFMLFYSSLNAITGGFGQIDYSAANAFLDAFAQAHDRHKGTRFISIDWDRWPGIGMASSGMAQATDRQTIDLHPLLGKCIIDNEDKIIYSRELSPESDWVLSEHLVLGIPTIAGTTYLEMARAAFEDITGNNKVEISEVLFLNPLAVKPGDKRIVYIVMIKSGDAYNFHIISKISGEETEMADWLEHIRGKIAPSAKNESKLFSLENLKEKCGAKTVYSQDGQYNLSEEFISFGGRWRSLKRFSLGDNEGLVEVELNEAFSEDIKNYKLHPALLDVATGAVRLVAGGNYLPFSYEKLQIHKMLPKKIYGYIRFKNNLGSSKEIITSDIDIIGENGEQLIEITNFSMKLVSEASAEHIKDRAGLQQAENSSAMKLVGEVYSKKRGILQEGITVPEGLKALHSIINGCFKSQIIVSTKDINLAIAQANYLDQPNVTDTLGEAAASKERHPRPEVENEYVPPKNETEKKLAEIWQDVLCIDKVGIHDEFFALGGDSLLLIQFHTKLKEAFSTDIAVVDLYKYNTIALLTKQLKGETSEEEQPVFDEINSRANKQKELMKKRRQQMLRGKGGTLSE